MNNNRHLFIYLSIVFAFLFQNHTSGAEADKKDGYKFGESFNNFFREQTAKNTQEEKQWPGETLQIKYEKHKEQSSAEWSPKLNETKSD
jgi:hypothetical protein